MKAWWAFPLFQLHAMRSTNQAKASIGLLGIKAFHKGGMDFCTLSTWESEEDMLTFKNSGSHLLAMKISRKIGSAYSVGWETDEFPNPELGEEKLSLKTGNSQ